MTWTKTCAITVSLLSLLFATVSFAQQEKGEVKAGADIYRASKLIGSDVENPQGEKLGDIEDVVLDPATGRAVYAVMSFGGFLGLGEKYFAIPWTALTPKAGEKQAFILNVDKERLRNAPGFDKSHWPDMADRQWGQQVHTYYGVTPYWEQREARRAESPERLTTPATGTDAMATVAATVQNVDQGSKLIRLKTVNDEIVELQAPTGLLSTLQAGDRVEVMIHKQNKAQ
jgi:sporulation protein YlmC with PRC-barrel domain